MKICEVQASPVTTYSETHCCRCWLECMDETKITVSGEEAALEDSMAGSHFYPDFAAVLLKQKVAEQYGLKAENVLTGAGSSAMIDMIGLTFLDDGDEVLFSAPTYGAFADMAYLNGGVPVSVPVTEEQKFNLPAMKEKIGEKTKIVVICNPNNPTGTYVPIGELEAFADTLPKGVQIRILDNSYISNTQFISLAEEVAEKCGIKYQESVRRGGSTNAAKISVTGKAVPCLVLGVPSRYAHSHYNFCAKEDLEAASAMAANVIRALDEEKIRHICHQDVL